MMEISLLLIAIVCEVAATVLLKSSDGLTKFWPTVGTVVGYLIAFGLLAFALKRLPVGPVYAVWAGLGTAGAAIAGVILFQERLHFGGWLGVVFVIVGVVLLGVFGSHDESNINDHPSSPPSPRSSHTLP